MEVWKIYEPYPVYSVSNLGSVRNNKSGRILNPSLDSHGYKKISIGSAAFRISKGVHKLVGEVFLENPNNYTDLDHINRDRLDNRVENLRWVSRSENCANREYKNQTGERCIHHSYGGKFKVDLRWKGTQRITKTFPTLEAAIEFRDSYYRNGPQMD